MLLQIIIDILRRAGDSPEWTGGGSFALPPQVLQHATRALGNLSDVQARTDAATFLASAPPKLLPETNFPCSKNPNHWHAKGR